MGRSAGDKRRKISETLRYCPDLANSNARSIAAEFVIVELVALHIGN